MKQRGKKSAASLAVVSPATGGQLAVVAPATLSGDERAMWQATIGRLPADWLHPEQVALARAYVAHACEAERLRAASRDPDIDLPTMAKLSEIARKESKMALDYARALRLTPHARVQRISAARRADVPRASPIDWTGVFDKREAE